MLIPPREFFYNMEKGLVTLFYSTYLPTGIFVSDVICDVKVVGLKYKGKQYYDGLLKKIFYNHYTKLVLTPHSDIF
jgi:hypothetical protein